MTKHALRTTALDILVRIGEKGGFSHLLIDQAIKTKGLSSRDEGLLTEMVYGTIQRKLTLAYFLDAFIQANKKIDPWVKWLLYMSFYQMVYLDKVPAHAIIHEAVEIAKHKGHKGVAGLVNGTLRNAQRSGFPSFDKIKDPIERLSIETSHPLWLVNRWIDLYGMEITTKICHSNLRHKPISVRIQPLKINKQSAISLLEDEGYEVESSIFSNQGLIIRQGNILKSSLFKNGMITIQDQSSMLVAEMLDLKQDMVVLDACSAPGGKATHIAEKMENRGAVHAYDLHDKKAKLVSKKAKELDLNILKVGQADSRKLKDIHGPEEFDRILLDAPCSGLGVLRSKPDIKYHKKQEDIDSLAQIQGQLMESVSSLLKKGGKLVYSTCTIDKSENESIVQEFLVNHPNFKIDDQFFKELPEELKTSIGITDWGLQLFPHEYNTDGFFLTRLIKMD
ncbi:16S rRNA (cytosine(967)-C(5))-methyltransferase RsmB [Aquibacillus salsiterrae]|uniref:16S rRNA (cytosine(967)-C(5))-methyltransferase n=1 Tax=Aquibacillus salsiterrae TaxID=2950439 RepID=A0A9X3WBU1_9BACI|nr:16S rRNA (cytosine(967)-C(5))-methyltransferase RsmB [Aquibacillus salsiterrae]MDC3416442.1 16S rRNA (cytosine(967)-C(5))-methyltransferase RsmB [Aquibacillus salsiterrae]